MMRAGRRMTNNRRGRQNGCRKVSKSSVTGQVRQRCRTLGILGVMMCCQAESQPTILPNTSFHKVPFELPKLDRLTLRKTK